MKKIIPIIIITGMACISCGMNEQNIDVKKGEISYQLYAERNYNEEGGLEYIMGIKKKH